MKRALLILTVVLLVVFAGCTNRQENGQKKYITINGDIEGFSVDVDYNDISKEELAMDDTVYNGARLSHVLEKVNLLAPLEKSYLMITARDGVSALIDAETASLCLVVEEEGVFNIKAPEHPRVVGIKDVLEITVIAHEDVELPDENALKIVDEEGDGRISFGNCKLLLFDKSGESRQNGNRAVKYVCKKSLKAEDFLNDDFVLYFDNFDMLKVDRDYSGVFVWDNGRIYYESDKRYESPVTGIVTDVDTVIYDAYEMMKILLDKNEKVMLILPDGLSYAQIDHFKDNLTILSQNYRKAASVNPAISNVALATIITGHSPYGTEIIKREVKAPKVSDIFEYVAGKGKDASYIEGNSVLVVTSEKPKLNVADSEGYTDKAVFDTAMYELAKNPDLIFIHFHGIDDTNHEYSPMSKEAENKIYEIEGYIKELAKNFYGHVIIVPDHGSVTIEDSDGTTRGKHNLFKYGDMYVPFYYFERGSLIEE
jgi:sulfur relay (sulfurtransferase) DsrF/TusC family protein